jgi:transcriptional regulator with GAF, ATPase, and Fis domain
VSEGPELQPAEKIDTIDTPSLSPIQEEVSMANEAQETLRKDLEQVQRQHILRTLQETGLRMEGDKGAAKLLGMNPSTLRACMRKPGVNRPGVR